MSKMAHLWGLPTVEPSRQTIGAALSVGVKPPGGGWPIEKDRFHIVEPKTREREEKGRNGKPHRVDYRQHDPRFAAYNEQDVDARKIFYGMLCYHLEQECWHPNYGMYRFPKGRGENPKSKRFACTGNGTDAERWMGATRGAESIPCPGEGCPFRSFPDPNPACMPRARFWFMPRWLPSQGKAFARYLPDGSTKMLLERPIMRLATQGREARDTFSGMLETVREQAEGVGFKVLSWYGLPFVITLSQGKNADKKTNWPDITFTLGGEWMDWIQWQSTKFRQLAEAPPVLALGSASEAELDADEVGAEHAAIVPDLDKPAATAKPAAKPEPESIDAEVVAEAVDEDPRSYRQRIKEDFAGSGLTPYRLTMGLRKRGLLDQTESFSKDNKLDDRPWHKVKAGVEEIIEETND